MNNKPFPFSACKECVSIGGGSDIKGINFVDYVSKNTAIEVIKEDGTKVLSKVIASKEYVDDTISNLEISGGIVVDDELSQTSTNPVQNKVITEALEGKLECKLAYESNIDNCIESGMYRLITGNEQSYAYLFVIKHSGLGATQYKIGVNGIEQRIWNGAIFTGGKKDWSEWKDVVLSSDIEPLEPFVVNVTYIKNDNDYGIVSPSGDELNQLAYDIIEAYKTGKQVILRMTNENNSSEVLYSSLCECYEYKTVRWHVHIDSKFLIVAIGAMESDDGEDAFWTTYTLDNASKNYVDTQIGDIETTLESIVTKYGLGGGSE